MLSRTHGRYGTWKTMVWFTETGVAAQMLYDFKETAIDLPTVLDNYSGECPWPTLIKDVAMSLSPSHYSPSVE
jgi:hypothetical protein